MLRPGPPRGHAAGLLLACAAALGACAEESARASALPACARLEQMFLARTGPGPSGWLLVGRFELRREEFLEDGEAGMRDLPMTRISWSEFEAWARVRGLRGSSAAEWRAVAGPPAVAAEAATLTRNTLELEIGRPLPVGVFERGRSPLGGYDFYGNVWEMTAPDGTGRVQALGGSFASREVSADARGVFALDVGDRAEDVGARYFADALSYFREQVEVEWRVAPSAAGATVRAAVARWQPGLRSSFAATLRTAGFAPELCALLED